MHRNKKIAMRSRPIIERYSQFDFHMLDQALSLLIREIAYGKPQCRKLHTKPHKLKP